MAEEAPAAVIDIATPPDLADNMGYGEHRFG